MLQIHRILSLIGTNNLGFKKNFAEKCDFLKN